MNTFNSPDRKAVAGAKVDNDPYTNALAFQKFLESEGYPFSLTRLDSIWKQRLTETVGFADYSICLIDSAGNVIEGEHEQNNIRGGIRIVKPLKADNSILLQTVVASPNRLIFQQMTLLLISSMLIAIIIGYCFYLQIRMIMRQNKIAEIRRDFTHAMVHEMKNPITSIQMGINTLKSGKLDDKEELRTQYFNIVADESEHLATLANKILTIARFEEKKVKLNKTKIELKPIFDSLIEKYKLKANKNFSAEVIYKGVESIYADKEYIYEVFDNLMDNAVKYAKETIQIQITCSADDCQTRIAIEDRGIGIPLKEQKHIFEKFERSITVRKQGKTKGFGLGLSFVYQVITAHGGSIAVDSVPGMYSEFIITLPNEI